MIFQSCGKAGGKVALKNAHELFTGLERSNRMQVKAKVKAKDKAKVKATSAAERIPNGPRTELAEHLGR